MKPQLVIFSIKYPFEFSEAFLQAEVLELQKSFEIILVPLTPVKGLPTFDVGSAVIKRPVFQDKKKWTFSVLKMYLNEMFYGNNFKYYFRYIKFYLNYAAKQRYKQDELTQFIKDELRDDAVLYSYWFANDTLAVSLLAEELKIKHVARVHRFDLYDEWWYEGRIPYRNAILKKSTALAPISQKGKNYLEERTPQYLHKKIQVARLGSNSQVDTQNKDSGCLHLVTCARLIKLKRVTFLAEILTKINLTLKWTVIGDGEELEILKKIEFPENITPIFKGQMSNKEVNDLYKTMHFDLFALLSESEGIPYSMIEAISYGVPVFSTDVGAINELVNDKTGVLVGINQDLDSISQKLVTALETNWNRKEIQNFHTEHFSTENNTKRFLSILETSS